MVNELAVPLLARFLLKSAGANLRFCWKIPSLPLGPWKAEGPSPDIPKNRPGGSQLVFFVSEGGA